MKKIKLVFFASALFFTNFAFAQTTQIKGIATNKNNEVIAYFSAQLLSVNDSSMIIGGAFMDGVFLFEKIKPGNYLLKLSSVGFEPQYQKVEVKTGEITDIGSLQLDNNLTLKEVIVTASIPKFKVDKGKMIINVKGTTIAEAGTAIDALNKCPGVTIDPMLNINITGKGAPKIFINGREVRSNSELEILQSGNIKSIEINRNPSASYDATATSVINIETIKLSAETLNLSIYDRFSVSRKMGNTAGIEINNKKGKFSNYLSYSYYNGRTLDYKESDIIQYIKPVNLHSSNLDSILRHSVSNKIFLGTDFKPNKRISIGLQYSGSVWKGNASDNTFKTLTQNDSSLYFHNNMNTDDKSFLSNLGVNSNINIDSIKTITINLDYALKNEDTYSNVREKRLSNSYISQMATKDKDWYNVYTGQIAYNTVFKTIRSEFGLKYSSINKSGKTGTDNLISNTNYSFSNLSLKEDLAAGYILCDKSIQNFTIEGGLRYEYVQSSNISDENDNVIKTNYNKHDLFPSFMVDYNNENRLIKNLNISFSRRINRPNLSYLNTFKYYFDSLQYSIGNPNLKPTYSNAFEFNMSVKNLVLTLDYTHIINDIESVSMSDNDNPEIIKHTLVNIDKTNAISGLLVYNIKKRHWSVMFNSGISKYLIYSPYLDKSNYPVTWNMGMSAELKFLKYFMLTSDFSYSSKGNTGISYDDPIYFVNTGLSVNLFNKKLMFKIVGEDIFKTRIQSYNTTYASTFVKNKDDYSAFHSIKFTIKYNFNNFYSKFKKNSSNQDELNRIEKQ